jgi:shikimate kinase
MQRIKADSMEALRGFWNTSYLHENVIEIVNRFDEGLEASKKDINDKKDEEINKLHEERVGFSEKLARSEAKQVEMEAENAELKATLKSILRQMPSNSGEASKASTSQNERAETSRGFFPRR